MPLATILLKLLGLSQAIQSLKTSFDHLEAANREKIAAYCEAVAATFARAAAAFGALDRDPSDPLAHRDATRELGRIAGYLEDIVFDLGSTLDPRKRAGLTRRLNDIAAAPPLATPIGKGRLKARIDRLLEAEGYFRALADGLRA